MMESSAADQMADTSDSFDSLSSLVSHVSDHDSTSPNVQPLDGTSPADEGNEMEEAGGPDSGIGSSFVDNHGPSQTAAAGDSQASGAAGNTATIPDDPFSKFAQDIRASVPDGDNVVSEPVPEQSRFAIIVNNLDGDDEMEAAGGDSDMGSFIDPFPPDVDNRGPISQIGAAVDSQASEAAGNTTTTADNVAQNIPDSVHEVTMGSEPVDGRQQLGSGVKYGGPADVASCAERIDKIKDRSDVEGQVGVLVDNEILRTTDNRYRENSHYDRVVPLGEEGSDGTVNLIQDRQSQAKAVEKRIPLKHFRLNEAIIWCRLISPYIVRFLGLIRTGTTVMIFSEYNVDYQTLEKICPRDIPIETQRALSLIEQLFQALVYIHTRDIVHGDIHGGNILINESADRISLKMIDFGESEKIDGHNYRRDVRCAIEILKRLCGARLSYDNQSKQVVATSYTTTDERLLKFLSWAMDKQPPAAEVLCKITQLIRELDSVSSSMIPVTGPPTDGYVPPEI